MEDCYNRVELCGEVLTLPEPSHTNHGETFYRFMLAVPRLSGQSDELPVLVRQETCCRRKCERGILSP